MANRDVRWLQRRTNIADLLDDGIENYSDIKAGAVPPAGSADADGHRPPPPRPAKAFAVAVRARAPANWLGILIGTGVLAGAAYLLVAPVDRMIYHPHARGGSFVEHVTRERSRVYGAAGMLIGIGLLGFSLYRPRR